MPPIVETAIAFAELGRAHPNSCGHTVFAIEAISRMGDDEQRKRLLAGSAYRRAGSERSPSVATTSRLPPFGPFGDGRPPHRLLHGHVADLFVVPCRQVDRSAINRRPGVTVTVALV